MGEVIMFIIEYFDHDVDWQPFKALGEFDTRLRAIKARDNYFVSMGSSVVYANKNYYRIKEL